MIFLSGLLILATAYQCYFLWRIFSVAFGGDKVYPKKGDLPSVSVIVCFRNEVVGLAKYQGWIKGQQYPDWELILVNDYSTDESPHISQKLAEEFSHVKLVQPPYPTRAGKKDALTYGISQAKHDILLLMDADCAPASDRWIELMTAPLAYDPEVEVVLGVSPYREVGTAVNEFQRFETLYTAFQYLGLAKHGMPYMGVGRNLAYRKAFFQRAGGLESHANIPGGDDDLLLSHHSQAQKTTAVTDPAAWTISDPATGWVDYFQRKVRHLGVGIHYPLIPKLLIGGLALSHVVHYSLVLMLSVLSLATSLAISLLLLRWILVLWVYNSKNGGMEQYRGVGRLKPLLFDVGLCLYYGLTAVALLKPGKRDFTGREF